MEGLLSTGPPQSGFNNDAPEEVCGDRKLFDSPLKKLGLKPIFDVDSRRALTLFSLI